MALNPNESGGDSHNWNYSNPTKDGFSTKLIGTVVSIQETQAMNFGPDGRPSTPKFWENNPTQPVMNIRLCLAGPSGGFRSWTITPAGKAAKEGKKKSIHLDLFALAGGVDMMQLVGKTIEIETVPAPAGFNYGVGNPRPWTVKLADVGPFALTDPLPQQYLVPVLLANQAVSGGVMQAPAQNMSVASGMPVSANAAPAEDDVPPF